MPAGAPCLQVCEQILRVNLGVNGIGVAKLSDPCVSDDGEHELCRLPSRGFKGGAVRAPCLVRGLESRLDDGRSIVVDLEIVCPEPLGFVESLAVALEVCGLIPNYPDEVVLPSRFVVRDLQ